MERNILFQFKDYGSHSSVQYLCDNMFIMGHVKLKPRHELNENKYTSNLPLLRVCWDV